MADCVKHRTKRLHLRCLTLALMVVALQLALLSYAGATIYKCVDEDGKVMFTDRACPEESSADKVEVENTTWVEPTPDLYKPRPKKMQTTQQKPKSTAPKTKTENEESKDEKKVAEEEEEKDFKTIFFDQYFYNKNHKPNRPVHPIAPIGPR